MGESRWNKIGCELLKLGDGSQGVIMPYYIPLYLFEILHNESYRDFPGGAMVNNLPANAGDMGSSPGPGRSHMPQSK